jgi:hypothetical protein
VLFTSGYTQNAIVHGGRLDPGVELISKPYRRDELARKIRQRRSGHQPAGRRQLPEPGQALSRRPARGDPARGHGGPD